MEHCSGFHAVTWVWPSKHTQFSPCIPMERVIQQNLQHQSPFHTLFLSLKCKPVCSHNWVKQATIAQLLLATLDSLKLRHLIITLLVVLLAALRYSWCWGTGRWYILSSFRFFPGVTLTFSKYILWYERWQWSLLALNLFPWHQETDISVSIWFWLQASGCYSKKMRVLCLTPSTARLQSFSSTEFSVFSTVSAEVLLVAIVFISYFSIVALFQWPPFSGEIMLGDFFQWAH